VIHSGFGGTHVNSFLSSLIIPPVSNYLLCQRGKEMGDSIEKIATTSTKECLQKEIILTARYHHMIRIIDKSIIQKVMMCQYRPFSFKQNN
jgi:hypothetical protein